MCVCAQYVVQIQSNVNGGAGAGGVAAVAAVVVYEYVLKWNEIKQEKENNITGTAAAAAVEQQQNNNNPKNIQLSAERSQSKCFRELSWGARYFPTTHSTTNHCHWKEPARA